MVRMKLSIQAGQDGCPRSTIRKSVLVRLVVSLLFWSGPAVPPELHAAGFSVQQVQSVFLFNFAQFVKWPAKAFPDSGSPLTIGVLGANPFGGMLDSTVRGETVDGRRMAVKYSRRAEDLKNCQIVFVSQSEAGRSGRRARRLSKHLRPDSQ